MNTIYTDMENLLAQVIQYMNTDKLLSGFPSLYMLFDISEESSLSFHSDQAPARGIMNIYKELLRVERRLQQLQEKHTFFTASPLFFSGSQEDPSCDGAVSCDLFDYHQCMIDSGKACVLHVRRIDIDFIYRDGLLKIRRFFTETIQTYEPWFYTKTPPLEHAFEVFDSIGPMDSADYIALKKLHNYLWDHLLDMEHTPDLCMLETAAAALKQIFRGASIKDKTYPLIGITGLLCADVDKESGTARCYQLAEVFRIVGQAPEMEMVRAFWQIQTECTCPDGVWHIKKIAAQPVMYLPLAPYVPGVRYDRWSMGSSEWNLVNTPLKGGTAQDLYEIENIMGAWAVCGRRGQLSLFAETYMSHPQLNPVVAIMSQGEATPVREGIEAIRERFAGMDARFRNHRYSMHVPTTPVVEVSEDGRHAVGTWYDHSATCLASGDETRFPYMVFVARYVHEFEKIGQKWYVRRFFWEPLMHLQEWELDLERTDGWAARTDDLNYPEPLALFTMEG